jgi:hypothetical protein
VAAGDVFEALAELGVAVSGLGEGPFVGGGLEVGAEEGGVVAVAGGVDADADGSGRAAVAGRRGGGLGHGGVSERVPSSGGLRGGRTQRKLVMRGQSLKM